MKNGNLAPTVSINARYRAELHGKQTLSCASEVFCLYVQTAASVFRAHFATIQELKKEPYGKTSAKKEHP
jgi:hypothetical protein